MDIGYGKICSVVEMAGCCESDIKVGSLTGHGLCRLSYDKTIYKAKKHKKNKGLQMPWQPDVSYKLKPCL